LGGSRRRYGQVGAGVLGNRNQPGLRPNRDPNALGVLHVERRDNRRLPKAVYRGIMLGQTARDEASYSDRRLWLAEQGLVKAQEREKVEGELASLAGLDSHQVIVYCPQKAPGHQQVEHWVTTTRNEYSPRQGSAFGAEFARRHLGLWEFWVFVVGVEDERKRTNLADVAQDRFGMPNMIDADRLQGRLF